MKIIRLFLISAIVLFMVLTFVFALFPSDIRISRVIDIDAPSAKTDSVIQELKTWDEWNEFVKDPQLTGKQASKPSSGNNAYIRFDQFRVAITDSGTDSISTLWSKKGARPFNGSFLLVPISSGHTVVQWYFDFHFRWYPWEKMGAMFYDKQLGPVMEKSLENLKIYVEKIP
jgi:hypothetical protein